jgi:hypothetical protein
MVTADAGGPAAAECGVAAFGVVRCPSEAFAPLRAELEASGWAAPAGNALKYADDQSAAALGAVARAVRDFGLEGRSFAEWGLAAAARFLGRLTIIEAAAKFRVHGAPGVSPLILPFLSQHTTAGLLSLTLRLHGPNFGLGGGVGGAAEALFAALTVQQTEQLPGVWAVATEWDPEPAPAEGGRGAGPAVCHAAALALTPPPPAGAPGLRLRFVVAGGADDAPLGAAALAAALDDAAGGGPIDWRCPLGGGGWLGLVGTAARPAARGPRAA